MAPPKAYLELAKQWQRQHDLWQKQQAAYEEHVRQFTEPPRQYIKRDPFNPGTHELVALTVHQYRNEFRNTYLEDPTYFTKWAREIQKGKKPEQPKKQNSTLAAYQQALPKTNGRSVKPSLEAPSPAKPVKFPPAELPLVARAAARFPLVVPLAGSLQMFNTELQLIQPGRITKEITIYVVLQKDDPDTAWQKWLDGIRELFGEEAVKHFLPLSPVPAQVDENKEIPDEAKVVSDGDAPPPPPDPAQPATEPAAPAEEATSADSAAEDAPSTWAQAAGPFISAAHLDGKPTALTSIFTVDGIEEAAAALRDMLQDTWRIGVLREDSQDPALFERQVAEAKYGLEVYEGWKVRKTLIKFLDDPEATELVIGDGITVKNPHRTVTEHGRDRKLLTIVLALPPEEAAMPEWLRNINRVMDAFNSHRLDVKFEVVANEQTITAIYDACMGLKKRLDDLQTHVLQQLIDAGVLPNKNVEQLAKLDLQSVSLTGEQYNAIIAPFVRETQDILDILNLISPVLGIYRGNDERMRSLRGFVHDLRNLTSNIPVFARDIWSRDVRVGRPANLSPLLPPWNLGAILRIAAGFGSRTAEDKGTSLAWPLQPDGAVLPASFPKDIADALLRMIAEATLNAAKHTENGTIVIEATVIDGDIVITVTNTGNGAGMTAEFLGSDYGLGKQAPEAIAAGIPGTGLGSGNILDLADEIGAEVEVTSTKDGITATVNFSITPHEATETSAPEGAPDSTTVKITLPDQLQVMTPEVAAERNKAITDILDDPDASERFQRNTGITKEQLLELLNKGDYAAAYSHLRNYFGNISPWFYSYDSFSLGELNQEPTIEQFAQRLRRFIDVVEANPWLARGLGRGRGGRFTAIYQRTKENLEKYEKAMSRP